MKRNMNHVEEVAFLSNVCLNKDVKKKEFYNFLVINTEDDIFIYDLSNGIDYSNYKDKQIAFIKEMSDVNVLYEVKDNHYQEELEIGPMDTIKIYKKAKIVNLFNNEKTDSKKGIIEFKDIYDNKIFLSYYTNEIYMRNNHYDIDSYKGKPLILFENGKRHKVSIKEF